MEPRAITSWRATKAFLSAGCSGGALQQLGLAYGLPLEDEVRGVSPLMGGIKMHGYQCGALWGAALAAGARAHALLGAGPDAEAAALATSQGLVTRFRERFDSIDCDDLNDTTMRGMTPAGILSHFFLRGGSVRCLRLCTAWAAIALEGIQQGLETPAPGPSAPVSCAAELARRAGASPQHITMAAGLAGGIGLSGDACGALGAAVWLLAMRVREERGITDVWDDEVFEDRFGALMTAYLEATQGGFECAEVVERRFEGVDDHAAWLAQGGCAAVIAALAEGLEPPQRT
jgi:hypothetical protein